MDKKHMEYLMETRNGTGVEIITSDNAAIYYFYEDFENDPGIDRATKQFINGVSSGLFNKVTLFPSKKKRSREEIWEDISKEILRLIKDNPDSTISNILYAIYLTAPYKNLLLNYSDEMFLNHLKNLK